MQKVSILRLCEVRIAHDQASPRDAHLRLGMSRIGA